MAFGFRSVFGHTNMETIPGVERKFMNTPLYDFLPLVYSFFSMEHAVSDEEEFYRDMRSGVSRYIDEVLQLALLLKELKKENAKGRGWHIESRSDIHCLYVSVESLFMKKVDLLPEVLDSYSWEEEGIGFPDEWKAALSDFPCSKGFKREDKAVDGIGKLVGDCDDHLSIGEIEDVIKSVERCKKAAKAFYTESDEAVAKRFVIYMIENKVPESREMYRCWYDALDCFYGIPDWIKKSHDYSQEEPRSNYIKAIASRYHKKKQAK